MLSCDKINWASVIYTGNYSGFDITSCILGDGDKNIYIKVSDVVGNESNTITKTITLDTTAPGITITKTPDTNSWTTSSVNIDLNCFDELPRISYWLNGTYNYSYTNYLNFVVSEDKNNELIYSCSDNLGNTDGNHYSYIAIDNTTPAKASISNKVAQKDLNILLNWNDVAFVSPITYFVWGKEITDTNFNLIIGPLNDSNYLDTNTQVDKNYCYFVQTINSLGQDSNSDIVCVMIDQNVPIIDSDKPIASVSNDDVTISFSATDTNGSGVKGYYVSKDKSTWYYTTSSSYTFNGLPNATYTFDVIATDFADNNSIDKNVNATVNYTAPSGGGGSPGGGGSTGGNLTITPTIIPLVEEAATGNTLPQTTTAGIETTNSGTENDTDNLTANAGEQALSPATSAFSLMDTLQIAAFPILLLLLLFMVMLIIIGGKKKTPQSQAGHGKYFMENDIDDFAVNKWSGKWEYNGEKER